MFKKYLIIIIISLFCVAFPEITQNNSVCKGHVILPRSESIHGQYNLGTVCMQRCMKAHNCASELPLLATQPASKRPTMPMDCA